MSSIKKTDNEFETEDFHAEVGEITFMWAI